MIDMLLTAHKRLAYNIISTSTLYFSDLLNVLLSCKDSISGTDFYKYERDKNLDKISGYMYEPSHHFERRYIKKFVKQNNCDKLNLLDVGSGKGLMLLYFNSHKWFKNADGIEYIQRFAEIAQKNLSKYNITCKIYNEDAGKFQKYHMYDVFYLYNPFGDKIFMKFIDKILESQSIRSRKITILYNNPVYAHLLLSQGFSDVTHRYKLTTSLGYAISSFGIFEYIPKN